MACGGTGTSRSYASRGRHRVLAVCLLCSGVGYVRHTSTHNVPHVNGAGPHTTIGRPPPPPDAHRVHRFNLGGLGGHGGGKPK